MPKSSKKLTTDQLGRLIYEIRGERVMLDSDLASIYGVETKSLNRAVKRNAARFPRDFMFQLTREEFDSLTSQNAMSNGPVAGALSPARLRSTAHFRLQIVRISVRRKCFDYNPTASLHLLL
jgi:hypothetical protein